MANESECWLDLKFMCARGGKIDTELRERERVKMEQSQREDGGVSVACMGRSSMWLGRELGVRCARVVRLVVLVRCAWCVRGAMGLRVGRQRDHIMGWAEPPGGLRASGHSDGDDVC